MIRMAAAVGQKPWAVGPCIDADGNKHIYGDVYTVRWEEQLAVARVFRSGNSQAVRLPKAFRLKGPEVEISRRGDEIVLREKRSRGLAEAFEIIVSMPLDAFQDIKDKRPPQRRKGL